MNSRQSCPNPLTSLGIAAIVGTLLFAGCPQTAYAQRPPLSEAALKRDPGQVNQLLAQGAKVNEVDNLGKTALIYAAGDNDRAAGGRGGPPSADRDSVVGILLQHHANPNATAKDGTTPLLAALVHHQAVSGPFNLAGTQNARTNKIRLLLAAGAKVNTHTTAETEDHLHAGATPLMAAAINGTPAPIKMLLAKGADINAKDQQGNTALIDAARLGNFDAVQTLIANHADVNARNAKGATALSEATRMKASALAKCADLLRAAGAK
jgi:ankyrin repeat protein